MFNIFIHFFLLVSSSFHTVYCKPVLMIDCYVNLVSVSGCRTKTASMHGMTYVCKKKTKNTWSRAKRIAGKTARHARKFVVKISVSQNCDSSIHQKRQKNAACAFLMEEVGGKKRNLVCYFAKYSKIRNWKRLPKICAHTIVMKSSLSHSVSISFSATNCEIFAWV